MANKVLLISETTIKKYTLVNNNVDGAYLQVAIQSAQEIDLCNILGLALYNKIIELVQTGAIASNYDYKNLLDDFITPYLCWQVMSTVQTATNYKLTNSGTIQNQDDKKIAIDYSNGKALASQFEKYANSYATRMIDFIIKNINKFSEYRKCENYEYAMDPQYCSIFLDDIPTRKYTYKYK